MSVRDVIVVGGGLAGLACARTLVQGGASITVLEAGESVGGRVQTDRLEGFLLDRGFQVFLTAYPEAQKVLDMGTLKFQAFYPGAKVFRGGRFHRLADPWRHPLQAVSTLLNPIGSPVDKVRVARLRSQALRGSLQDLFARPQESSRDRLRRLGFSDGMVDAFFRPFFAGIFLEKELTTSSRMLEFVFRMMSSGSIALPMGGMGSVPKQLASQLPAGSIRLKTSVARVHPQAVELENGERLAAGSVVVATDGTTAAKLVPEIQVPGTCATTCLYFAADSAPLTGPYLLLNGTGAGVVNSVVALSEVASSYAPQGQVLMSVSLIGAHPKASIEAVVRKELAAWFGQATLSGWRHLRTYVIEHALPSQPPSAFDPAERPVRMHNGVFVCGDHRDNGSIQGALVSGRRTAEAVLATPRLG